ncbi:MAG: hypothetical protein ACREQ5_01505 [Candidatus Dormibacteria bacterium]
MASIDPASLAAILTGSSVYVSLLPHLSDVRRASEDSATARDVRVGIGMASAALIGAGAVVSVAERDARPVMLTVALTFVMGAVYMVALKQPGEPGPVGTDRRGWPA